MTISDVMKRTGLSRKAIYLYEDRGLLSPDKISRGIFRCREYSESDIERLITISRLRALDVPIDEICHIFNSDCRIDIVLQEHLVREKSRLSELTHSVRNIEALLKKLPPNSHVQDFDIAADGILPRRAQGPQVQQDYSANFTRRIAMQLYEAFLDRPLDTVERMDAWYQILAGLEAALTPEFLEAFDGYYCAMTAEQVYEDYRLRHRLVNGYPHYGKTESAAKAREIYTELFRLTQGSSRTGALDGVRAGLHASRFAGGRFPPGMHSGFELSLSQVPRQLRKCCKHISPSPLPHGGGTDPARQAGGASPKAKLPYHGLSDLF